MSRQPATTIVVELEVADATACALLLRQAADQQRHRSRLPPASWDRAADLLTLAAQLHTIAAHVSDLGQVDGVETITDRKMVNVNTAANLLHIDQRSVRRHAAAGRIPGAHRIDRANARTSWLIPLEYIARKIAEGVA